MIGQRHAPAALPPGKTRYTLYRRLGGLQGRSGRVRKISPPPGFDIRTVQPVTSRYTDCAIPAHGDILYRLLCESDKIDEMGITFHWRHWGRRGFHCTDFHAVRDCWIALSILIKSAYKYGKCWWILIYAINLCHCHSANSAKFMPSLQLFVKNSCAKFYENSRIYLVAGTTSETDRQTDRHTHTHRPMWYLRKA